MLYLARFLGLSCLLMCASLAVRPRSALRAIGSLMQNEGLLLVTGILTAGGGVALVVGHNLWHDGVLALVVTILGWLTLIKGVALLAVPPETMSAFYKALHYETWFRPYMLVATALSAWLTVAAFLA